MAEAWFYHLTRSSLEATLPALLERTLARGLRAEVRLASRARAEWLDQRLWLGDDAGFLPHGLAGGAHDRDQPVLLSWQGQGTDGTDTVAAAPPPDFLFATDGVVVSPQEAAQRQRLCVIFNGADEAALQTARGLWKTMTEAAIPAVYWAQTDNGWSERLRVPPREGGSGRS